MGDSQSDLVKNISNDESFGQSFRSHYCPEVQIT